MASHGDVTEIQASSADLGTITFKPKAGEGNTFSPGGVINMDDENSITTDGQLIVTKNRVAGGFTVTIEDDQNVREDVKSLFSLAGNSSPIVWTLSLINGAIYRGVGIPVGKFETNLNDGTMPLKVNGTFNRL